MHHRHRVALVLSVLVFLAAFVGGWRFTSSGRNLPTRPIRTENSEAPVDHTKDLKQLLPGPALSVAGCSAAACHGGAATTSLEGEPGRDSWKHAATHWLAVDPHRRAYRSLTSKLADDIVNRLRAIKSEPLAAKATEEPRCLACHVNPTIAQGNSRELAQRRSQFTEGVGCEACHGNAGSWALEHPSWQAKDRPSRYVSHGMINLYDLGVRAAVCAGCHVGSPANAALVLPLRDVNHDMIAAGHPRLNFELADFEKRLPPHWQEKNRSQMGTPPASPAVEVRLWLVGRIASAEAACRLLADRADRADSGHLIPWPELAESNCFGCHHQLLPDSWRLQGTGGRLGAPGTPPWQTFWPLTQDQPFVATARNTTWLPNAEKARLALRKVRMQMQSSTTLEPGLTRSVALSAAIAIRELRDVAQNLSAQETLLVVMDLCQNAVVETMSWDEACQLVGGLSAIERVRVRIGRKTEASASSAFAPVYGSLVLPRPPRGASFNSPRGYDPATLRSQLRKLMASVEERRKALVDSLEVRKEN